MLMSSLMYDVKISLPGGSVPMGNMVDLSNIYSLI